MWERMFTGEAQHRCYMARLLGKSKAYALVAGSELSVVPGNADEEDLQGERFGACASAVGDGMRIGKVEAGNRGRMQRRNESTKGIAQAALEARNAKDIQRSC